MTDSAMGVGSVVSCDQRWSIGFETWHVAMASLTNCLHRGLPREDITLGLPSPTRAPMGLDATR